MYCSKNEIFYSLKYYGKGDAATYAEVNNILCNTDGLSLWLRQIGSFSIQKTEDYITFLEIDKLSHFIEMVEAIKEPDDQRNFEGICRLADQKKQCFNNRDIIMFLNTSIKQLFDNDQEFYGLTDVTISLCAKFNSGINEQGFEYLIEEQGHLVIDNYRLFQKRIEGSTILFQKLFSLDNVEKLIELRLDEFLRILEFYCNEKSKFKDKVSEAVNFVISYGEEQIHSATVDNIIRKDHEIRVIHEFLQNIMHPKANNFADLRVETDKMLGEHLKLSGSVHTIEIPTKDIKNFLESENIPWITKIINITHASDETQKRMKSNLDFEPEARHPLLDMARSNIPTNDYFSFSHQQSLRVTILTGGITALMMLEDEKSFEEGTSTIMEEVSALEQSLSVREKELADDFVLLTQMLYNVFRCDISEEIVIQSLCYGASTFISTIIEKILRLHFIEQTRAKIYVPVKNITLGALLRNKENSQVSKALGEYQTNHLRYFLLNDEDGNVGCNYRNRLAHWNEMKPANLTKVFVAQLFYLLLSVINSLVLYYLFPEEDSTGSDNK